MEDLLMDAYKRYQKEIKEKKERQALEKLSEKHALQEFNVEVREKHVVGLSIRFKGITEIPKEIEHFPELTLLDLSRNQIPKINSLTNLKKLKMLRLRENKIQEIEGLENCTELMELDLSDNLIRDIKGLYNLWKLESLELSRNKIQDISGLDKLKNLKILKMNGNPIKKIQNLDHLAQLETLLLAKTGLKKIEGLENLKGLKELNLSLNNIEKIEGLENNGVLRQLNLADNHIVELEKLGHLTFLQEISLVRNRFSIEDLRYSLKPAKEIVDYCHQKADRKKNNLDFQQKIKTERDSIQIKEELSFDTEIASKKDVQKYRENLIQSSVKSSDKTNNPQIDTQNEIFNNASSDRLPPWANSVKTQQSPQHETETKRKRRFALADTLGSKKTDSNPSESPESTGSGDSVPPAPTQGGSQARPLYFMNMPPPKIEQQQSPSTPPAMHQNILLKNQGIDPIQEEYIPDQDDILSLFQVKPRPSIKLPPRPVPNPHIVPVLQQQLKTENEWIGFALQLFQSEDYQNALLAYRNVLQLNTHNVDAWKNSGIAFNNKGDYKRAVRAFKQAIALSPSDPGLWGFLGIGLFNMGEVDEATKAFKESLDLSPTNDIADQYLSQIPEEVKKNILIETEQAQKLAKSAEQDHQQIYSQLKSQAKARGAVVIEEFYNIEKLLAFTTYSKLWLTEDLKSGEKFVLKQVLYRDLQFRHVVDQIALREIALLSRFDSPNIIPLLDYFLGQYQNTFGWFIKLPYYPYGTLEDRIIKLKEQFALSGEPTPQSMLHPNAVISVFVGMLEAISSIHKPGLIHRDIKPDNIIINSNNQIPRPEDIILIDFGLAITTAELQNSDELSDAGCGTKGFSPPEQLQSGNVDVSADIFAIAASIYHAITYKQYSGEFYLPDYTNEYYQPIAYIFPLLQRMLDPQPKNRPSSQEAIQTIITRLRAVLSQ